MTERCPYRFSWGAVPYPERSGSAGNRSPPHRLTKQTGLQEQGQRGVVARAFNPIAQGVEEEAEAWRHHLRVKGQSGLHRKFQNSQGYVDRPSLKTSKTQGNGLVGWTTVTAPKPARYDSKFHSAPWG